MEINYVFIGVQSVQLHVLMTEAYTSKCAVNRLTIAGFFCIQHKSGQGLFWKIEFSIFYMVVLVPRLFHNPRRTA